MEATDGFIVNANADCLVPFGKVMFEVVVLPSCDFLAGSVFHLLPWIATVQPELCKCISSRSSSLRHAARNPQHIRESNFSLNAEQFPEDAKSIRPCEWTPPLICPPPRPVHEQLL